MLKALLRRRARFTVKTDAGEVAATRPTLLKAEQWALGASGASGALHVYAPTGERLATVECSPLAGGRVVDLRRR
jgi:hypothetical protein